jgi:hypothetical protein
VRVSAAAGTRTSGRFLGMWGARGAFAADRDASWDVDGCVLVRARLEAHTRAPGDMGGDTGSRVRVRRCDAYRGPGRAL